MRQSDVTVGECNIGIQLLADKCKDQNVGDPGTDVWVRAAYRFAFCFVAHCSTVVTGSRKNFYV